MRRATTATRLVIAMLFVQACGASDVEVPSGPTVADASFGGRFMVEEISVRGDAQGGAEQLRFDIDAEFGALRVTTPCGDLLGSFSFLDDGRAGITISGGSTAECSTIDESRQQDLLALLGRINSWSEAGPGFSLRSPEADSLELAPG